MAKWGEGDPRWIVEERADATNVNNWHWTEKNATSWSKDRLKALLIGMKIDGAAGVAELKEFTTLEGEASASNRKSKLIFFYEWDIKIKWTGTLNTESMDNVEGEISIPNLSDEQDLDDISVEVSCKPKKSGADALKEMVRTKGADQIREQLDVYIKQLKKEFSQGMILPTDAPRKVAPATTTAASIARDFKEATITCSAKTPVGVTTDKSAVTAVKIATKKISLKETFMCSTDELYRCLTEENMVRAFTKAPVLCWQVEKGGKFSLFDGAITGEFIELIPNQQISQRWRFKTWPEEHYSTVTIKLAQSSNCTTLTLSQTGVPSSEEDRTKQGWHNYYWNSIRQTFGFAVDLF